MSVIDPPSADGEPVVVPTPDTGVDAGLYTPAYRNTALALLALVYIFNFVDRQVLNILAQAIKVDLNLSDTQLGLVTGLAFALFYSLLGLPLARYAERGDRPGLIAFSLTVWSSFTIACGFATAFVHLLIFRLGVGFGEAGSVPPSHSLITEFTPKSRRALALALFSCGLPLGSFIGLGFGGVLGDAFGWRNAFIIAGAPGLLIAVAVALVIKEPRRGVPKAQRPAPEGNLFSTLALILSKRTFRWVAAAGTCQSIAIYGVGAFVAPFFLRAHGDQLAAMAEGFGLKTTGLLGLILGVCIGLAGAVGNFMGGYLGDRFSGKSIASYVVVPGIGSLISVPLFILIFHTSSVPLALLALALAQAGGNSYMGGMHATCQGLVSPRHRATMSAFLLVILNLIGLGVGPPLVGMISDYARETLGMADKDALGLALTIISTILLLGAFCFWQARRSIDAETVS